MNMSQMHLFRKKKKLVLLNVNILLGEKKPEYKFEKVKDLEAPTNFKEFQKNWRRYCDTLKEKFNYFLMLNEDNIEKFFEKEIDSVFITSIFQTFSELFKDYNPTEDESKHVSSLFKTLTKYSYIYIYIYINNLIDHQNLIFIRCL